MRTIPFEAARGHLPEVVAGVEQSHEFTAHGWDLAHATGRLGQLDPDLAVQALEAFSQFAPPETRSGHGPFGPVVPVPEDGEVYSRPAAYLGRQPQRAAPRLGRNTNPSARASACARTAGVRRSGGATWAIGMSRR